VTASNVLPARTVEEWDALLDLAATNGYMRTLLDLLAEGRPPSSEDAPPSYYDAAAPIEREGLSLQQQWTRTSLNRAAAGAADGGNLVAMTHLICAGADGAFAFRRFAKQLTFVDPVEWIAAFPDEAIEWEPRIPNGQTALQELCKAAGDKSGVADRARLALRCLADRGADIGQRDGKALMAAARHADEGTVLHLLRQTPDIQPLPEMIEKLCERSFHNAVEQCLKQRAAQEQKNRFTKNREGDWYVAGLKVGCPDIIRVLLKYDCEMPAAKRLPPEVLSDKLKKGEKHFEAFCALMGGGWPLPDKGLRDVFAATADRRYLAAIHAEESRRALTSAPARAEKVTAQTPRGVRL